MRRNPGCLTSKTSSNIYKENYSLQQRRKHIHKNLGVMKHKFNPNRIYNVDEMGISTVLKPGRFSLGKEEDVLVLL
jgi:hypothetical protein